MAAYGGYSDQELLALLRESDEAALNEFYKRYWEPLYISVNNILRDGAPCEDIIQEIFIKLWDKRQSIEIHLSVKAYLFASCRYEVFRLIKTQRVREDIFDGLQERLYEPSAYGSLEHKELIQQINSIVERLPEKCREVYKLSREENLSHKEIAERLGISTKTVENHITRALTQFRASLGGLMTIELIAWWMKK
ncbi:MAG: RNA polymerase sigma-70 factor [Pedobacter sp.]|nr:MAG: RNA polymerase sigma-70 factor [Pedobacter sp.]